MSKTKTDDDFYFFDLPFSRINIIYFLSRWGTPEEEKLKCLLSASKLTHKSLILLYFTYFLSSIYFTLQLTKKNWELLNF
jgi:hypothetical protein